MKVDDEKHDVHMDAMDAYRVARNNSIKTAKELKRQLAALGWGKERIDAACKTMAEFVVRHS